MVDLLFGCRHKKITRPITPVHKVGTAPGDMEQLTLDEKLQLVHGGSPYMGQETQQPARSLGGAGWIPGIPRLGIPDFQMTDGRSGVANIGNRGRYATALPSALAAGATWDPGLAYDYGATVGREVRELGFNVSYAHNRLIGEVLHLDRKGRWRRKGIPASSPASRGS